jgi:hypothetical protein
MRHVIGFVEKGQQYVWPLMAERRIRFDTANFHSLGYFDLIAPAFEPYAQRDANCTIHAINVLFVLEGSDLTDALHLVDGLEVEISRRPAVWREFLGTRHPPRGAPAERIEPRLLRRRALCVLRKLRVALERASLNDWRLVYGNGVSYRHLMGIKLPPGVVEYS